MEEHEGDDDVQAEKDDVDDSKLKLPAGVVLRGVVEHRDEAEESEMFKMRCKLYRFAREAESPAWKERGTGDAKILRHAECGCRFVLRQEKTHKLVANFFINPSIPLELNVGSDRCWNVTADDYSEGELRLESYAIKFRDVDVASSFKAAYDAARTFNAGMMGVAEGGGSGGGGPESDGSPVDGPVLVVTSLSDVYPDADVAAYAEGRLESMAAAFESAFGAKPQFFTRAPGRVNLIGEHIDYHGYSVLPMALGHDVVIAVGVADDGSDKVLVRNLEERFAPAAFPADAAAPVEKERGIEWQMYVQCGYKGAFEAAVAKYGKAPAAKALNLLVHGAIPTGAGVSSSSALVVASALATARAHDVALSKSELAEACRLCEYHIGTMGGGMDQAISCLAAPGKAMHIAFNPLKATPVALPGGCLFVVANSMVVSSKAVDASFNIRVTEGKLAAKLIAKKHGLARWQEVATIGELQRAMELASPADVAGFVSTYLSPEPYTKEKLLEEFGEPLEGLFEGDVKKPGALMVLSGPTSEFKLSRRALHVAMEAARVEEFRDACSSGGEGLVERLGAILSASHASCRDDYECSCPELDTLCAAATANGAVGARLTGAGWGGCAVFLVPLDKAEELAAALTGTGGFYAAVEDTSTLLFTSKPMGGAAVVLRK